MSTPEVSALNFLLYEHPIVEDASRKTIQSAAVMRLSLFRAIEQRQLETLARESVDSFMLIEKYLTEFSQQDKTYIRENILGTKNSKEDNISHYICRMIFCQNDDRMKKFINYEQELFSYKLSKQYPHLLQPVLQVLEKHIYGTCLIKPLASLEFQQHKLQILASCRNKKIMDHKQYYKIPFTFGSALLSKWQCFAYKGYIYPHVSSMYRIARKMYSQYLRNKLQKLSLLRKQILEEDNDNQVRQFINNIYDQIFVPEATPEDLKQRLSLKNISILSKKFPPCMLNLLMHFERDKHLKHQGRLQFLFFLKEAGMSLQDAEQYWMKYMKKGVTETVAREQQYLVKHAYGKVGGNKSYNAFGCEKVIGFKVSAGEHHGCPFKHFGKEPLKQLLKNKYNVNPTDLEQIIALKQANHQQVACRTLFKKTHPDPNGKFLQGTNKVGRAPEMYFYQSCKYEEVDKQPSKRSLKVTQKQGIKNQSQAASS